MEKWQQLFVFTLMFFYAALSHALCYYLTDNEGNIANSLRAPYDLSYPDSALSPADHALRARLGHLSITLDETECDSRHFSETLPDYANTQASESIQSEQISTPQPVIVTTQTPEPPVNIPDPVIIPPSDSITTSEVIQSIAEPLTVAEIEQAILDMAKALTNADLDTYQQFLADNIELHDINPLTQQARQQVLSRATYIAQLRKGLMYATEHTFKSEDIHIKLAADGRSATADFKQKIHMQLQGELTINPVLQESIIFVRSEGGVKAKYLSVRQLQTTNNTLATDVTTTSHEDDTQTIPVNDAVADDINNTLEEVDTPEETIEEIVTEETVETPNTDDDWGEGNTNSDDDWDAASSVEKAAVAEIIEPEAVIETIENVEVAVFSALCTEDLDISQTACQNLVDLYQKTEGKQWKKSNAWLSNTNPCQWQGVKCEAGLVVSLSLSNNGLKGHLPSFKGLPNLIKLSLFNNKLSGPFPDLSALTQLQFLRLSRNQLTGVLPDLSHFSNLISLKLKSNQLTGSIPDLSALSTLETINLSKNQFSGDLSSFAALGNLEKLNLSNNQLTGTIPELPNKLQKLMLNANQLSGVIPNLNYLIKLKSLHLENNQFTGQLPDLDQLRWIKSLNVSHNQLSGILPESLKILIKLEYLQVHHNQLTGHIPDLSTLKHLEVFNIKHNQLCGKPPLWLQQGVLNTPRSAVSISNNNFITQDLEADLIQFLQSKDATWQTTQNTTGNCQ